MKHTTIRITNGRVIDPRHGFDALADVFIADGRIAAIGQKPDDFSPTQTLDAGIGKCGKIDQEHPSQPSPSLREREGAQTSHSR